METEVNSYKTAVERIRQEQLQRQAVDKSYDMKYKYKLTGAAALLGIILDVLFYEKSLGINYPMFVILLVGFFHIANKEKIIRAGKMSYLMLASILLLSATYAIFNNTVFAFFNFLLIPFLICIYTLSITDTNYDVFRPRVVGDVFSRGIYHSFRCYFKPIEFVYDGISKRSREKASDNSMRRNILIGLGISFLMLLILVPMLISADMAFKYYMKNLTGAFDGIDMGSMISHGFIVIMTGLYFFAYTWSFKYPSEPARIQQDIKSPLKLDEAAVLIILTVVNTLYLLFTVIQFSFLYAGASSILPEGINYSEYARSGFFDLVKATAVNLAIILGVMKLTKSPVLWKGGAVKGLLSLLVFFTVNLLFSAFFRMSLYESTYGFTELRLYVYILILFFFTVLFVTLLGIWLQRIPLVKSIMLIALVFYLTVNYINVEAVVARKNIERYYSTGTVDIEYLSTLSVDAVHEVYQLTKEKNSEISNEATEAVYSRLKNISSEASVLEYNYFRSKAYRLMRILNMHSKPGSS